MAVHKLLMRGLIVGMLAGLVAFGVAKLFGEPAVDRAIAFEAAASKADGHAHEHANEPELVSRFVQANVGAPLGAVIYGGAVGGIFSLIFAVAYGRFSRLSPKPLSAVLALLCFVAAVVVPFIKYPASPPAAGEASTIAFRTGLFVLMISASVVAMMAALSFKQWVEPRIGGWNAGLAGGLVFIALASGAALILPSIDEVPANFPAATLWQFRVAAFGVQAVLWSVLGIVFGLLTERSLQG